MQEKTELSNFRAKARGPPAIVSLSISPSVPLVGRCHLACVEPSLYQPNLSFHWPGEILLLHAGDSLGHRLTQIE